MCTSNVDKVPLVVKAAMEFRPETVIDVGIGFGKYGLLLREYLEFWENRKGPGRYKKDQWRVRLTGVEVFEPFVMTHHAFLYDEILIGDVRDLIRRGKLNRYDLCLLCDVLEHMPKEEGVALVEEMRGRSKHVVVTAPNGYVAQGPAFGNEFERHVSGWTAEEFVMMGFTAADREDFVFAAV